MRKNHLFTDFLGVMLTLLAPPALFWGTVLLTKIVYVFVGLIFGWFIGLFFESTILGIFAQIGITGFSMWQIGAFLGFVGSFFGSTTYFNPKQQENNSSHRNIGMYH